MVVGAPWSLITIGGRCPSEPDHHVLSTSYKENILMFRFVVVVGAPRSLITIGGRCPSESDHHVLNTNTKYQADRNPEHHVIEQGIVAKSPSFIPLRSR